MIDDEQSTHTSEEQEIRDASSLMSQSKNADVERRAILASLGKLAALTPPTVVTLMMTTRPAAAS